MSVRNLNNCTPPTRCHCGTLGFLDNPKLLSVICHEGCHPWLSRCHVHAVAHNVPPPGSSSMCHLGKTAWLAIGHYEQLSLLQTAPRWSRLAVQEWLLEAPCRGEHTGQQHVVSLHPSLGCPRESPASYCRIEVWVIEAAYTASPQQEQLYLVLVVCIMVASLLLLASSSSSAAAAWRQCFSASSTV